MMPNFEKKLRQSPWYIGPEVSRGVPVTAPLRIPKVEVERIHPLALINPAFWTWDAERVLRVFQLFGVLKGENP